MSVDSVIPHPLYDRNRLLYDYAILRTKELIPFSRSVNAACLPQSTTPDLTDGKNLQISGWGKESKILGSYQDALILKVGRLRKIKSYSYQLLGISSSPRHPSSSCGLLMHLEL